MRIPSLLELLMCRRSVYKSASPAIALVAVTELLKREVANKSCHTKNSLYMSCAAAIEEISGRLEMPRRGRMLVFGDDKLVAPCRTSRGAD